MHFSHHLPTLFSFNTLLGNSFKQHSKSNNTNQEAASPYLISYLPVRSFWPKVAYVVSYFFFDWLCFSKLEASYLTCFVTEHDIAVHLPGALLASLIVRFVGTRDQLWSVAENGYTSKARPLHFSKGLKYTFWRSKFPSQNLSPCLSRAATLNLCGTDFISLSYGS